MTAAADRLRTLAAEADAGPWWFDGRDIFHKKPGTNLDQIIIPLGHVISDTYTADGAVNPATCKLAALAPQLAALAADMADAFAGLAMPTQEGECWCARGWANMFGPDEHSEACDSARALLARLDTLTQQADDAA